jgi:hypothetical protein
MELGVWADARRSKRGSVRAEVRTACPQACASAYACACACRSARAQARERAPPEQSGAGAAAPDLFLNAAAVSQALRISASTSAGGERATASSARKSASSSRTRAWGRGNREGAGDAACLKPALRCAAKTSNFKLQTHARNWRCAFGERVPSMWGAAAGGRPPSLLAARKPRAPRRPAGPPGSGPARGAAPRRRRRRRRALPRLLQ